jgi:hypothetical protein
MTNTTVKPHEAAPVERHVGPSQHGGVKVTPTVWVVFDENGLPVHCASWPEACHEHIADAIASDIPDAGLWVVREYEYRGA